MFGLLFLAILVNSLCSRLWIGQPRRSRVSPFPVVPRKQELTSEADPLLYDELVRQFQTPAEREADGKAKGYGRVLEGSLLRGEARLAKTASDNGRHKNFSHF